MSSCLSFFRMDCNAVFSEIFRANVFYDLGSTKQNKIITKYIQSSCCNDCVRTVRVNNKVFVHYLPLQQLRISGNTTHDWPNYIMTENLQGSFQCTKCDKLCNLTSSTVENADVSFVEFDVELAMVTLFPK